MIYKIESQSPKISKWL